MISLCHFDSIDFRFVLCSVRVFFFILLRLRLFGCFYFLLIYLLLICLALFPWFERTVTKNSRMNLKCGRLLWLQLRALLLTGGCLSVFGWCVPFNWHCTTQRATLPMQSANNRTLCVLCVFLVVLRLLATIWFVVSVALYRSLSLSTLSRFTLGQGLFVVLLYNIDIRISLCHIFVVVDVDIVLLWTCPLRKQFGCICLCAYNALLGHLRFQTKKNSRNILDNQNRMSACIREWRRFHKLVARVKVDSLFLLQIATWSFVECFYCKYSTRW